jgi:hypothetical protein
MNETIAKKNCGGLSFPSKMPCSSYSIPAQSCKTGSKLVGVKDSVCHGCYALKNFYRMPNVKKALQDRLKTIYKNEWVDSLTYLIKIHSNMFHRWHDSGDLQDEKHLEQICKVARKTKEVKHWIPTREYGVVKKYKKTKRIPSNLIIRLSAHMVNQRLKTKELNSMVVTKDKVKDLPKDVHVCPSSKQGNKCLDCRACWSKKVKTVAYIKH